SAWWLSSELERRCSSHFALLSSRGFLGSFGGSVARLRLACSLRMARVDVVVVSYNNSDVLRPNVERLCREPDISVFVVDNQSTDGSLETIADLPATGIQMQRNLGFAAGCNAGWRAGSAPYVLFLNPDARISSASVNGLAKALSDNPEVGIVGPKIVTSSGALDFSQRLFPRLRSTYARALFVHRLLPNATWSDEMVRQFEAYEGPRSAEWVSGACILVRRHLLEELDGWDDGFFMYCEDKDLCKRAAERGYEVRFEPSARCVHVGGASAPRSALLPVLAASRLRYAHKHASPTVAVMERLGLTLEALVRLITTRGGRPSRNGRVRSLLVLGSGNRDVEAGAGMCRS